MELNYQATKDLSQRARLPALEAEPSMASVLDREEQQSVQQKIKSRFTKT